MSRYLRYITIRRLWNAIRSRLYFQLSRLGFNYVAEGPTFVSVEPAAICQLRCPECPVGCAGGRSVEAEKAAFMPMSLYRQVVENIAPTAHTLQLFFQGEPLLCRDLPEMVRLAHELRLYTIISTNGQAMTPQLARDLVEAGLDRIIVSVDGLSEESYAAYRVGGSLQKALSALRYLREAKRATGSRVTIVLQCLRLKSNEHEWRELRRRYRELGADRLEMKTAQFYDYEHGHPLMPTDPRYSRYKPLQTTGQRPSNNFIYRRKRPYHNYCYRLWSGCVITTTGEVLPCCFDKAHQYSFGNIREIPFPWLWHTVEADAFRSQLLRQRTSIPICLNCTE